MKRKWRVGRVVLAGLVLTCAALMMTFWLRVPRWSIPAEDVLGFDLSNNTILTSDRNRDSEGSDGKKTFTILRRDLSDGHLVGQTTLPADHMAGGLMASGVVVAPSGGRVALWGKED